MKEKNDEMPEELNEEWMRLGMEASEKEDYERAFEYFKKAVEEDPTNWRAVYEKGKISRKIFGIFNGYTHRRTGVCH